MNAGHLKGLQLSSLLKKDTWLQIKPLVEVGQYDAAKPGALGEQRIEHLINRVVQIDGEDDSYEYW